MDYETLERIESNSFAETEIEAIYIPSSVKTIGKGAFRGCKNLKTIFFSEGLVEIEEEAFEGCVSLTDITLPKSLRKIGTGAFRNCSSLRFLDVESPVIHEIESYAFAKTGLQFVTLRMEEICVMADDVFANCPNLEWITFPNGPTVLDCNLAKCVPQVEIHAPNESYTENFSRYYGLKFQALEEE